MLYPSSGRVGTNWLLSLLKTHPDISAGGELLSTNGNGVCTGCGVNGSATAVYEYLAEKKPQASLLWFKCGGPGVISCQTTENINYIVYMWRESALSIYLSVHASRVGGISWVSSSADTHCYELPVDDSIQFMKSYYKKLALNIDKYSKRGAYTQIRRHEA